MLTELTNLGDFNHMIITASGGTDGANIVLFWPDNMPDDADQRLQDDPIELVESLRDEGKLIWFPCDGDGRYSASMYVQTSIADELSAFCKDGEHYPKLEVNGDGYFGGMEYMFKTDRSFLDRYPHMCEQVAIPNGSYAATVYFTDLPESHHQKWLVDQVGHRSMRLWMLQRGLVALSVSSVFSLLGSSFFLSWTAWMWAAGLTIACIASAVGLAKSEACKAVAAAKTEYERAFPAYVVHLA